MATRTTCVKIYFNNPYSPHEYDYPETDGYLEEKEANQTKVLDRFETIRTDTVNTLTDISWCSNVEVDEYESMAGFPADIIESTIIEVNLAHPDTISPEDVKHKVYKMVGDAVDAEVTDVVIATPRTP